MKNNCFKCKWCGGRYCTNENVHDSVITSANCFKICGYFENIDVGITCKSCQNRNDSEVCKIYNEYVGDNCACCHYAKKVIYRV